jgi:diguanylate cyclase (GGDEF)-like protein/PAS domain S-box-containing protein
MGEDRVRLAPRMQNSDRSKRPFGVRALQDGARGAPAGGEATGAEEPLVAIPDLHPAASLLRVALEYIDQGVSVVDANLCVVAFNRRFVELLEFPEGRFRPGMLFESFIRYNAERGEYGPGHVEGLVAARLALARCFEPHCFERVRPNGTVLEVRGKPLPSGGFVTTYTDITERKRVEAALQESEARFRDFAETAADWLWETDLAHRFAFVSEDLEARIGLAPGDLLGRTPMELTPENAALTGKWKQLRRDLEARRPFQNFTYPLAGPRGTRVVCMSGRPILDDHGGFRGYRGAARDVTQAHELSEELSYHATHDALTGFLNRRAFEDRLQELLLAAKRDRLEHVLCYLDLDQFKVVNDTCGHQAGDALLRQLAVVLASKIRKNDVLARIGGDEFGIVLEGCGLESGQRIANDIRAALEDFRFVWKHRIFRVGVSIGLTPVTERDENMADVMATADTACYLAKEHGRNRIYVWREDDTELGDTQREMEWVARIQEALDEDRFRLFYQPIVPIAAEREGLRYELLLRMQDEAGGLVLPGAFMPAAERYDLASRLDRWVLEATLRWLETHPGHVEQLALCCVNISGQSLDTEFLDFVMHRVHDAGIPFDKLCFEIAETAAIAGLERAERFMRPLKARGCCFALDDFGSGLSSFAYLRMLPVDFLKIDSVFTKGVVNDPFALAMVKSIVEIARALGNKTIAELIDDPAVLERLKQEQIAIDYAQGHHIGKPSPLDDVLHRAKER